MRRAVVEAGIRKLDNGRGSSLARREEQEYVPAVSRRKRLLPTDQCTGLGAQRVRFPCPRKGVSATGGGGGVGWWFSTWLVEDHAQVHPEGANPSGNKGKGLRMESLEKGGVSLDLQHLSSDVSLSPLTLSP